MPEDPKLTEFRDRNIALVKELDDLKTKYEGIDPDAVKADRAKLAELEKAKPHERITALEAELANEKSAHAETRKRADSHVIESKITDAFLKAGGRPEARGFIVAQAEGQFTVENGGQLKGTKFSPNRAGEPMSLDEWLTLQTRENAFCFYPSSGSGSTGSSGGGGSAGKVLRNPTPHDLGRFAKKIASGAMKVSYE